jgi:hypothetical protein
MHRIFNTQVSAVYVHYLAKVTKKGRDKAELDATIEWLTGYKPEALAAKLESGITFVEFFEAADMNPKVESITGIICGVRIEEIQDPLMKKIRYLDKLVDELAKGKPLAKVFRE